MTWLPEQDLLLQLFDTPITWWLGLLAAGAVGAAHALAPGHGKTITAAYLVGSHGRMRHAMALGAIVAAMHTVSVLVLAAVWVGASGTSLVTEALTAWMQVLAAVVVIGVGSGLVRRRLARPVPVRTPVPVRELVPAHAGGVAGDVHPGHDGRGHRPDHDHDSRHHHDPGHHGPHHHGPEGHVHVPPVDVEPWSRRGLMTLGATGGLLPSPTAFLVLVSGLLTGRLGYALVLVSAFAVGMAGTLAGVGALTVTGRDLVVRASRGRSGAVLARRVLPSLGAFGVVVVGLLYLAAALPIALRV